MSTITNQRQTMGVPPARYKPVKEARPLTGLVALGWITAILLPAIGFILGIVIVTRPDERVARHGTAVIAASLVAALCWTIIIAALVYRSMNMA